MASVKKRPDGKWRARYRDEAGKEHARHFERKVDGQRWLDEVTASLVRGDYVAPESGKITVASYAQRWESAQVGGAASARIVDNALRLHLLPALGDRPMASVTQTVIQGWVKGLESKGLAAGSVRNIYDVAWRLFDGAVHDRVIPRTPFVKIKLPGLAKDEVVVPTLEQVQILRSVMPDRFAVAITLIAGSGLRIGEALGLQVADVDFLRRTVRVERQLNQAGELVPPKSGSARTVPVGQVVIDALAAHLTEFPSSGFVITDEFGRPVRYWRWKKLWAAAAIEAHTSFTAHALRHFFASVLISGGASVKQVQTALGHSSPVITLKVYTHLWPGDDDKTRNVVDAALSPLADYPRTGTAPND